MSSLLGAFDYYNVRSNDVKVIKSRWNFVKTKITTPGNNIYTFVITFTSSKFHFPYKLSYYAWTTCGLPTKIILKPVICGFCSHSAKPAWWYGKLCRSVVQGAHEVGTESFFFVRVDFLILIQSSVRTHVRMAVLIRCVTCFIFGDQEKFLAAKFTFQHFDLVSFTAERLFFSELRPSH